MKTRLALTDFMDELIYKVVLGNRYLSDAAEMPDTEYKALRFIHRNPNCTMKEIAEFTGVSLPRATKIADSLIENGYALRVPGPDRRTVALKLSAKGRSAIAEASKMHQDLSEVILKPLSPEEREQMYVLLMKCYEQLKTQEYHHKY